LAAELYETYMESSSASRNYDGREPHARELAREAEWLMARAFVTGTIGADYWMSLRLTPAGRDYVEEAESPQQVSVLTQGEDPAVVGEFKAGAVPDVAPATEPIFDAAIEDGVDVLLVTAAAAERDAMLSLMKPVEGHQAPLRAPLGDLVYFVGRVGSVLAALTMTRIGATMRDGATLAVNEAIGVCNPRAVIAVGIAWGMNARSLRLGDVLVSTHIVPLDIVRRQDSDDVWRGARPEAGGLLLNRFRNVTGWKFARPDGYVCTIKDGPLLSGESLVDSLDFKTELHTKVPDAIGGEMEGTGIYGAAAKNRGEWIIVKAVCDWADGNKDKRAQPLAAAVSASLVAHVLAEPGTLGDLPRMDRRRSRASKIAQHALVASALTVGGVAVVSALAADKTPRAGSGGTKGEGGRGGDPGTGGGGGGADWGPGGAGGHAGITGGGGGGGAGGGSSGPGAGGSGGMGPGAGGGGGGGGQPLLPMIQEIAKTNPELAKMILDRIPADDPVLLNGSKGGSGGSGGPGGAGGGEGGGGRPSSTHARQTESAPTPPSVVITSNNQSGGITAQNVTINNAPKPRVVEQKTGERMVEDLRKAPTRLATNISYISGDLESDRLATQLAAVLTDAGWDSNLTAVINGNIQPGIEIISRPAYSVAAGYLAAALSNGGMRVSRRTDESAAGDKLNLVVGPMAPSP
jgi:nucleoside phosphorylase